MDEKEIKKFIKEIQEMLGCDSPFARRCFFAGLAEALKKPEFAQDLWDECMNAEAGIVCEAAMIAAGRQDELKSLSGKGKKA